MLTFTNVVTFPNPCSNVKLVTLGQKWRIEEIANRHSRVERGLNWEGDRDAARLYADIDDLLAIMGYVEER